MAFQARAASQSDVCARASETEADVSAVTASPSAGPAVAGEALLVKVSVSVVAPDGLRLMGAQVRQARGRLGTRGR